jgi:NAD(P)H-dependent FMN reductase
MSLDDPHVVVLSGSLALGSRTDRLARWCADECARRGATTSLFPGAALEFPFYRPGLVVGFAVRDFLAALVRADGVVLLSPTYHGAPSGLLKNALDYVNEIDDEDRPYLDGRPVGCVTLASGEQGAVANLATLRAIAHALRGWPTPLGVTLSTMDVAQDADGRPTAARAAGQLHVMLGQVLWLARVHRSARTVDQVASAAPG